MIVLKFMKHIINCIVRRDDTTYEFQQIVCPIEGWYTSYLYDMVFQNWLQVVQGLILKLIRNKSLRTKVSKEWDFSRYCARLSILNLYINDLDMGIKC